MRRVVLLALLALALPVASMASSVDYGNAGSLGTTASMTFAMGGSSTNCTTASNCVVAGGTLNFTSQLTSIIQNGVTTPGILGTVSVTTGTLVSCGTGCFTFTGGTLNVWNNSSQLLFHGTFSGTLMVISNSTGGVTYQLAYSPTGAVIGGFQVAAGGVISGNSIVTPEPGTLGLLGTGLVGLAGLVRRKMRG